MTSKATVVADSVSDSNIRISSLQLRYWRAIHGEFMTHRVFSRNASSSRAIPVKKMLSQVWNDPAGPVHWGANRPGMQAREELAGWRLEGVKFLWKACARTVCLFVWGMSKLGLHKQVANRPLEPWQYINVLVTSTEWDNFFALRRHPDAQPEIQDLANKIHDALEDSSPQFMPVGGWHIPYVSDKEKESLDLKTLLKVSTARNARTSYFTHEGNPTSVAADVKLHDRLVVAEPLHASPAEHVAQALPHSKWAKNFRGWKQYRTFLENKEDPQ